MLGSRWEGGLCVSLVAVINDGALGRTMTHFLWEPSRVKDGGAGLRERKACLGDMLAKWMW